MELSTAKGIFVNRNFRSVQHNGGPKLPKSVDGVSGIRKTHNPDKSDHIYDQSTREPVPRKEDIQHIFFNTHDLQPIPHFNEGEIDTHLSSARTRRDVSTFDGNQSLPTPVNGTLKPDIWYDVSRGFDRYCFYAPVIVNKTLQSVQSNDFSFSANLLGSQLNLPSWYHELSHKNDQNLRVYLRFGVENGFLIVDEGAEIHPYENKCFYGQYMYVVYIVMN